MGIRKTAGKWGIPHIPAGPAPAATPEVLLPYGERVRTKDPIEDPAVHFFLDDARFEAVWGHPKKCLTGLRKVGTALTPDFSLYTDAPLAVQLYNVYRNRWCGAFWASHGIRVIPTVSWSTEDSFEFCFDGIEAGSVVAISTVGVSSRKKGRERSERASEMFAAGYTEMVTRLEPAGILVYGETHPEKILRGTSAKHSAKQPAKQPPRQRVRRYPSRWENIRQAKRESQNLR